MYHNSLKPAQMCEMGGHNMESILLQLKKRDFFRCKPKEDSR
jgi:hypothetical protein